MKNYGQQVITLKDMVIEHLMGCMEKGATITALRKVLGGSTHALTTLLEKMVEDGEAIKLKTALGDQFKRVLGNPEWAVSANIMGDTMKDLLEDNEPVEAAIDLAGKPFKASWKVSRPTEAFKLSPRAWIEQVAGV